MCDSSLARCCKLQMFRTSLSNQRCKSGEGDVTVWRAPLRLFLMHLPSCTRAVPVQSVLTTDWHWNVYASICCLLKVMRCKLGAKRWIELGHFTHADVVMPSATSDCSQGSGNLKTCRSYNPHNSLSFLSLGCCEAQTYMSKAMSSAWGKERTPAGVSDVKTQQCSV